MTTKGENKKEKILEVAENLILEKGFSGASIDEIIAASSITKSGFFYHFESKNDLAKHLMLKYQRDDRIFFEGIFDRAHTLSEDPLQQMLIFLNLLAEAMENLPDVHPGCLIAAFTSANHQLSTEVKDIIADCTLVWRDIFSRQLEKINQQYTMKIESSVDDLADMLIAIIEGGVIVSRVFNEQKILPRQILFYRDYLRLIYTDM